MLISGWWFKDTKILSEARIILESEKMSFNVHKWNKQDI
jgi:hypothetical protein